MRKINCQPCQHCQYVPSTLGSWQWETGNESALPCTWSTAWLQHRSPCQHPHHSAAQYTSLVICSLVDHDTRSWHGLGYQEHSNSVLLMSCSWSWVTSASLSPVSPLDTSSLCQPRSSHHASPSSQQLWSAGFFCGQPCDMELVTRQSERSGIPAISRDSFKRSLKTFLFSAYSCTQCIRAFWTMRSTNLLTYLLIESTRIQYCWCFALGLESPIQSLSWSRDLGLCREIKVLVLIVSRLRDKILLRSDVLYGHSSCHTIFAPDLLLTYCSSQSLVLSPAKITFQNDTCLLLLSRSWTERLGT